MGVGVGSRGICRGGGLSWNRAFCTFTISKRLFCLKTFWSKDAFFTQYVPGKKLNQACRGNHSLIVQEWKSVLLGVVYNLGVDSTPNEMSPNMTSKRVDLYSTCKKKVTRKFLMNREPWCNMYNLPLFIYSSVKIPFVWSCGHEEMWIFFLLQRMSRNPSDQSIVICHFDNTHDMNQFHFTMLTIQLLILLLSYIST